MTTDFHMLAEALDENIELRRRLAEAESAALKIAIALDNLGSRIYRDVHAEHADLTEALTDPADIKMLNDFTAFAEERFAVLDDPEVKTVLDAAMARRDEKAQR